MSDNGSGNRVARNQSRVHGKYLSIACYCLLLLVIVLVLLLLLASLGARNHGGHLDKSACCSIELIAEHGAWELRLARTEWVGKQIGELQKTLQRK